MLHSLYAKVAETTSNRSPFGISVEALVPTIAKQWFTLNAKTRPTWLACSAALCIAAKSAATSSIRPRFYKSALLVHCYFFHKILVELCDCGEYTYWRRQWMLCSQHLSHGEDRGLFEWSTLSYRKSDCDRFVATTQAISDAVDVFVRLTTDYNTTPLYSLILLTHLSVMWLLIVQVLW